MPSDLLQLCRKDDILNSPALRQVELAKTRQNEAEEFIELTIQGVSRQIEMECRRPLLRKERTEVYGADCYACVVSLRASPVTAVAEVREAIDGVFANVNALVATEDFMLDQGGRTGLLMRRGAFWCAGAGTVQVKYTGGVAVGVDDVPEDLRRAAILQVTFEVLRNPTLHLASLGMQQGSASLQADVDLLPLVMRIIAPYRRFG
jgi:hypothetical protein